MKDPTKMEARQIKMMQGSTSKILFLVIVLMHLTNAQSRLRSDLQSMRAKRDFNSCGSRLIDILNRMCDSNVWEPQRCFVATRYYCMRRRFRQNHPICHFKCVATRKRRSALALVDKTAFINELRNLFRRRPEHQLSDLLSVSERNRIKRNIYSECCHTRCNVTVIQEYCSAR